MSSLPLQKITANLDQLPRAFSPELPASRVETGPLQVNDDWPGIFIRGDNAIFCAWNLDQFLTKAKETNNIDIISFSSLEGLRNLLLSCNIKNFIKPNDSDNHQIE